MSEAQTFTQADVDRMIKERTKEIREQRSALQAELAEARTEAKALTKKTTALQAEVESTSDIRTKLTELQAKHEASSTQWAQDRVLLQAGITDPDVMDVLRSKHGRAEKPGEFGEWWEAEGRNTTIAQAFLSKEPAQEVQAAPEPEAPKPNANGSALPVPPPAQDYVPGQYAGDIEAYKRNRAAILADTKTFS